MKRRAVLHKPNSDRAPGLSTVIARNTGATMSSANEHAHGDVGMVGPETHVGVSLFGDDLMIHGAIVFRKGDSIDVARSGVPEAPGACVVWGLWKGRRKRMYLGKDVWEGRRSPNQGLRRMIFGPQRDGAGAKRRFEQLIDAHGIDSLRIEWFIAVRCKEGLGSGPGAARKAPGREKR
jgi:hypothetical protein